MNPMRRLLSAFREWLELRRRVGGERRFHLDQAEADFRALGLSRREAKRAAQVRFGSGHNRRAALQQIGAGAGGLIHLFCAYRVGASAWLQSALLLAATGFILLLSPSPHALIENVIGRPLHVDAHQEVFFSAEAPPPLFSGITATEFQALRTLPVLTGVERFQTIYARAVSRGAPVGVIQKQARARTGNPHMIAVSRFGLKRLEMGPAIVAWVIAALAGLFALWTHLPEFGKSRWVLYAAFTGFLHCLASLTAWALAMQIWSLTRWPTRDLSGWVFSVILIAFLLSIWMQCRYLLRDLYARCPICLERMLLASTQGNDDRMLLSMAVTESVCAHGHGVLTESRWERQFRRDASPLRALIRV